MGPGLSGPSAEVCQCCIHPDIHPFEVIVSWMVLPEMVSI